MSDNCKTIKCNLQTILSDHVDYGPFFDIIKRANNINFVCSHFIRCYVLYCFNNDVDIPILNKNFIHVAFRTLSKKSLSGPHFLNDQLILFNKLNTFYIEHFKELLLSEKEISDRLFLDSLNYTMCDDIDDTKYDSKNMSYIFNLFGTEMVTSYTNNIKLNFFNYLNKYVNQNFIYDEPIRLSKEEYHKLSTIEKQKHNDHNKKIYEQNKILKKELLYVKQDLINGTVTSDNKYHIWINEQKKIILPELKNDFKTHDEQLQVSCDMYLKYMLIMNKRLENNNKKMFQVIPLRTSMTDKYVHFDTSCIKEIFNEVHSGKINNEIWKEYFNIDAYYYKDNGELEDSFSNKQPHYKLKNYSFNHQISTDGHSVSINFIKNGKKEAKKQDIKARSNASKNSKNLQKNKTEDEIKIIKEKQELDKINKKKDALEQKKRYNKEKKEVYKTLPKEEQDKIKLKIKLEKNNNIEYIEDAVKNKVIYEYLLQKYKENKFVFIDPGMRALITALGKGILKATLKGKMRKGKILYSYNNRRRLKDTKRLEYNKKIDKKKKEIIINNKSLKEQETELSKYNSKTTNFEEFKKYTHEKINLRNDVLKKDNYNEYIKRHKWYGYINRERHEEKILNELEELYGSDAIIILGDWSERGSPIKYISTPSTKIREFLSRRFKVYLIDEYRTSCLYHKTGETGKKLKIKEDNREIHAVLTFKMLNNKDCINRDYNSVSNMDKITEELMKTKERPEKYRRTNKALPILRQPVMSLLSDHIGEEEKGEKTKTITEEITEPKTKSKHELKNELDQTIKEMKSEEIMIVTAKIKRKKRSEIIDYFCEL